MGAGLKRNCFVQIDSQEYLGEQGLYAAHERKLSDRCHTVTVTRVVEPRAKDRNNVTRVVLETLTTALALVHSPPLHLLRAVLWCGMPATVLTGLASFFFITRLFVTTCVLILFSFLSRNSTIIRVSRQRLCLPASEGSLQHSKV
jgi:hypothetical protein